MFTILRIIPQVSARNANTINALLTMPVGNLVTKPVSIKSTNKGYANIILVMKKNKDKKKKNFNGLVCIKSNYHFPKKQYLLSLIHNTS